MRREALIKKSIVYKALEAYQLHLQADASQFEESECNAVTSCIEYLEKSGEVNDGWMRENIVISNAVAYFHKQLDEKLKDATEKDVRDYNLITVLRIEQRNVSNLYAQLNDLYL